MSYMYPNDARLRGLNYNTHIFCDIGVKYIIRDKNIKYFYRNFYKNSIGSIPIMLHSKCCLLNNMDSNNLSTFLLEYPRKLN